MHLCEQSVRATDVTLQCDSENKKTQQGMTEKIQLDKDNKEQQLAYELVAKTDRCLFITGKAGTGKTTFIQRIQEEIDKNFLVLAPTGIAAIKAGGQTLHSFFGFPMEAIGPHSFIKISKANEELLSHVDTIIVDEVSMVRSDLIDGMDRYLRLTFKNHRPFGGKQVIFVGDLYQLPPVVKRGSVDAEMLENIYGPGIPFFYKASVLKRINLPKIEFQKVYRQKDEKFVDILNRMRVGELSDEDVEVLNSHIASGEDVCDYSVILTGNNRKADKINQLKLDAINEEERIYEGVVCEEFNMADSPAPKILKLKVGAQVIFIRNDYKANCANGTIGKVVKLEDDAVVVKLENGNEVSVERSMWTSYSRTYCKATRKIESSSVGTYTQFPLKLAWAITIHRSQGMTFDRMHLDLSSGMFAPGQTYVAISRMRSIEGLTLGTPIKKHYVSVNPEIKAFSNSFNNVAMIEDEIETGQEVYKYIAKNDSANASSALLKITCAKIRNHDYRNAALQAKQMFDIMLDDEHLMRQTSDVPLIPDSNMTANFLNSVLCLYGERYEEAIGYADLVLSRRRCMEAMFVKARAYYESGNYAEASDILFEIVTLSNDELDKKAIDKKLLLFEAKVNDKLGNSNAELCKALLKLCPSCRQAYVLLRKDLQRNDIKILDEDEEEELPELARYFADKSVTDSDLMIKLSEYQPNSSEMKCLQRILFKKTA